MRIFFLMRHSGYIRNYESVIKMLAERGYHIHLAFLRLNEMYGESAINKLVSANPNVDFRVYPKQKNTAWSRLAEGIRKLQDYLRYLTPYYKDANKLRERAALRIPRLLILLSRMLLKNNERRVWRVIRFLRLLESSIPENVKIKHMLRSFNPDLFLVTPLVDFGASQLEWIKCAKALGIRTVLCVASWDNLTNKGLIQIEPDTVIIWNEYQKEELTDFHRIPPSKIIITGAQCYDHWFQQKPTISRSDFYNKIGLKGDKPLILYLGSSPFISPHEVKFVKGWVKHIKKNKDTNLSGLPILIRPHPQNTEQWKEVSFSDYENVVIFPQQGANPIDEESKADFFHSIYYSCAVVGVNTSAMIEAGILSKPVFTVLSEEFKETQEGTLHFRYIAQEGLLYIADDVDEHIEQLNNVLNGEKSYKNRIRDFIKSFLRPRGIEKPATPVFADAVEQSAKIPRPIPESKTWRNGIIRTCLFPFAVILSPFDFTPDQKEKEKIKKYKKKQGISATIIGFLMKIISPIFRPIIVPCAEHLRKTFVIKKYVIPWLIRKEIDEILGYSEINHIKEEINRISESGKPIIAGPWISEVGFELLYWIPFLNWIVDSHRIDKNRLFIVSRGGGSLWYKGITNRYTDVFDYFTQQEFKDQCKRRIENTGGQKHNLILDFDKEIIQLAAKDFNITDFDWLHPSFMYRLFTFYWRRKYSVSLISKHTKYKPFSKPQREELPVRLPENYIATKFYFNESFPNTPENRSFIKSLLDSMSKKMPVVLLSTGISIDDHSDFYCESKDKIYCPQELMTVRNNLDIQTRIISNASLFVGTYGGFSYLAPFYGISSIAFYSREDKFLPVHLDVAYRVCRFLKCGEFEKLKKNNVDINNISNNPKFLVLDVGSLDIIHLLLKGDSLLNNDIKLQRTA